MTSGKKHIAMTTPRVAGGMVTSGPYFSMMVRLIEPNDRSAQFDREQRRLASTLDGPTMQLAGSVSAAGGRA